MNGVVRVRELVVREVGAGLHDQALGIDEPAALPRLGFGIPRARRGHVEIGDAGAGLARAEEEQIRWSAQRTAGEAQAGDHAGQGDRGRALDVVVEARQPLTGSGQQAEGVRVAEVLPLQQRLGENRGGGRRRTPR
jgi:hypothetical protein